MLKMIFKLEIYKKKCGCKSTYCQLKYDLGFIKTRTMIIKDHELLKDKKMYLKVVHLLNKEMYNKLIEIFNQLNQVVN